MKSFTARRLADQKKKKKNASLENSKDGVLKFTQPKNVVNAYYKSGTVLDRQWRT